MARREWRKRLTAGLGFRQGRGRGADDGDVLVVPDEGGADNGVLHDVVSLMVSTKLSYASCHGDRR
jgi:hypothetical protein